MTVICTANIQITSLNGFILGKAIYEVHNSSLPGGVITKGREFSFPVLLNLAGYTLNSGSTSAPAVFPGVQSTSISILTTNAVPGYATEQPITLTGRSVSALPFIQIGPLVVEFSGIVIGAADADEGSDSSFIIANIGQASMTILGYGYTNGTVVPGGDDHEPAVFTNVTVTAKSDLDEAGVFTSSNLPVVGPVIPGGSSITVNVNFQTDVSVSVPLLGTLSDMSPTRKLETIIPACRYTLMAEAPIPLLLDLQTLPLSPC